MAVLTMVEPNPYGFNWGPMKVERLIHVEGRGYVLEIRTEHATVQIHVTEKGRKIKPYPIRVYAS